MIKDRFQKTNALEPLQQDQIQNIQHHQRSISAQQGSTLIEVLIAFLILAFGLLGIAGVLMLSLKANTSNISKQQAIECIHNIIDKMRLNSQAALNGNYNVNNIGSGAQPSAPGTMCSTSTCTSAQLATYDIWDWLVNEVGQLPGGTGSVQVTPNATGSGGTVNITVQWDDSQIQSTLGNIGQSGSSSNYVSLSIQTQL